MLVGYQFQYEKTKTPLDFLDDVKRPGFRVGETLRKATGAIKTDLTDGIEHATLPPLAIWRLGKWYDSLKPEHKAAVGLKIPQSEDRAAYVTPGEGTPGNYMMRVYLLPFEVQSDPNPKHPMMWPKKLKTKALVKPPDDDDDDVYGGYYSTLGAGFGGHPKPSGVVVTKPPVNHAPPLPAGIRMRCVGCGHWFKESTLAQHNTHCCPVLNNGVDSDWVIMCECCETLDEIGSAKPGFPRAKPEKKTVEVKEVKPSDSENGAEPVAVEVIVPSD